MVPDVTGLATVLGTPCLITFTFGVEDSLDDFGSPFCSSDFGDFSGAEVESGFEPFFVSFGVTTLCDEGGEMIGVGSGVDAGGAVGAVNCRRDIDPHSGHLALNFAIALNL